MSIATELTRIQQAKADIKTAIEAKGVTVPSSATIDTYDDYVSQISGGGGSPTPSNLSSWSYDSNGNITSISYSGASIPDNAYKNNMTLTSVTIDSGCTSIGQHAFSNYMFSQDASENSLSSVTFNEGLTTIGSYAFLCCTKLTSLVLPSTLTSIGSRAFIDCYRLGSLTCLATTPPAFGPRALQNTSIYDGDGYIYVPADSLSKYQSASGWSDYSSQIQAIQNS